MANQKHLDILRRGVEQWDRWREGHPEIPIDLSDANLSNINLVGANLSRVNLVSANLSGANLSSTNFVGADLNGADLENAIVWETIFDDIDLRPVKVQPDLNHAKLRETNLRNANFHHANLYRAHFSGTDLSGMNLSYSELSNAQLDRADLFEANLSHANLSSANLLEATLIDADLSRANLAKANLYGASLIRANLKYTCLNDSCIYGISAWNVQLEGASQRNLVISGDFEPTVTVDNLEIAQFIYLLLNHKKLRDVFNFVTEKGVLLLGRFSDGGLDLLQAIAAKLRAQQYLPITFDFNRPDNKNYTETVKTLVGLSRFIIVDLSDPSVPQELYSTVPHYKIPFVPIIEEGRKTYAMFTDLLEYPWVLPLVQFSSQQQLLELLQFRVVEPAEEKFKERQALLESLFSK